MCISHGLFPHSWHLQSIGSLTATAMDPRDPLRRTPSGLKQLDRVIWWRKETNCQYF